MSDAERNRAGREWASQELFNAGPAAVDRLRVQLGWLIDDALTENRRARCTTAHAMQCWKRADRALQAIRWASVFLNDTDDGKFEEWFGEEADEVRRRIRGEA